jgi:hypothetical protein
VKKVPLKKKAPAPKPKPKMKSAKPVLESPESKPEAAPESKGNGSTKGNTNGNPSNAEIARANQLAEAPSKPIVRMMKHEVQVGDTVCYFADVEDRWQVTELRGPWLRAQRSTKNEGFQSQCFLTDTMVPLELALKLPRAREDGSVILASVRRKSPTRARKAAAAPSGEEAAKTPSNAKAKPKLTRKPRGPRAPVVAGTATAADKKKAAKYLEGMREEHGACESIRATVKAFPKFTREEIVEVAKLVGINPNTAAIQYGNAKQQD